MIDFEDYQFSMEEITAQIAGIINEYKGDKKQMNVAIYIQE